MYYLLEKSCKIIFVLCIAINILACAEKQKSENPPDNRPPPDSLIIDCNYTFEEAIAGTKAPEKIIEQLTLIDVTYYSSDNKLHRGQLLLNKKIAEDIKTIFAFMRQQKFPVEKVIPIVKYGWNDNLSMEDNNTSAFCYRNISYSFHAYGMAVDINPLQNPVIYKFKDKIEPRGGRYDPTVAGSFYPTSPVVAKFKEMGFRWGGDFSKKYDYHHFEKGAKN
ncbi:MAG: M15 family metallopeptidase [Prevotellaceae bacterium]|jgi:hypothetical protein|nr:M15 family metallopeptidase [Prevotellaceae bacterium]